MPVERRTPAGSGLVEEEWRDSWSSLPQVYASAYSATPSYGLRGRPSRLMHAVHQRLSGKPVAGNPHGRFEEGGGGWVYSRSSPTLLDKFLLFICGSYSSLHVPPQSFSSSADIFGSCRRSS